MVDEVEVWYPLKNYEGLYEVSTMGRIKSLNYNRSGKPRILSLSAKSNHYIKVGLTKDGKTRYCYVHRLVGETFLPQPQSGETQINHISGCKQDNRLSNIEYVTPKANVNNPNTKPRMNIRYHREGEFERRSAAQKKRFKEHPEQRRKIWETRRRNRIK